jgi:hypothetical protein
MQQEMFGEFFLRSLPTLHKESVVSEMGASQPRREAMNTEYTLLFEKSSQL